MATAFRARASTTVAATHVTSSFGESRFPIIFAKEFATASTRICRIEFFTPLFGAERNLVNPAKPIIKGEQIHFREPGEYYLKVNGDYLKVLVLDPSEGTKEALLRMFDFFVANNLYLGADDNAWYQERYIYLRSFFRSCEPMMLSCGPSHSVWREWVAIVSPCRRGSRRSPPRASATAWSRTPRTICPRSMCPSSGSG